MSPQSVFRGRNAQKADAIPDAISSPGFHRPENLKFPHNTFDTVVASCVFCSVHDPIKGFREIKRVCKNEGNIFLLEHVRSQKKIAGKVMDILNPISSALYGDNINRKTYDNLIEAGFKPSQIETVNVWSDVWKIFRVKNG